jgi:hypothetical protein
MALAAARLAQPAERVNRYRTRAFPRRPVASVGADLVAAPDDGEARRPRMAGRLLRPGVSERLVSLRCYERWSSKAVVRGGAADAIASSGERK